MTETHTVHDPFLGKDVQVSSRLVDRLRGRYASGPTMANGEPEFGWREFPVPPIQKEAGAEIERLRAALQKIADLIDSEAGEPLDDAIKIAGDALASPISRELEP